MEQVQVTTDFPCTEDDLRKFFSFCGELATFSPLFHDDDIVEEYKALVTFSSGTNSALLLDNSTYEGHIVRVRLVKQMAKQVQPQRIPKQLPEEHEEARLVQQQAPTVQQETPHEDGLIMKGLKGLGGLLSFVPKMILSPCMRKPAPEAQYDNEFELPAEVPKK